MEKTENQQQLRQLFIKGIDSDTDINLLPPGHNSVREAVGMKLTKSGVYKRIAGDSVLYGTSYGRTVNDNYKGIALIYVKKIKVLVEFYYDTVTSNVIIYANGEKVGENSDYPGDADHHLDIAEDALGHIYITDRIKPPIVLDVQDMIESVATNEYFTEYDKDVHYIQHKLQVNQPVFMGLIDKGVGGGVRPGSYSYAFRYVDKDGNRSVWSPSTPVINVPGKNNEGRFVNFPSLGFQGTESSLTPTRYGIKIAFRVTNIAGFEYIEVKRIPNREGLSTEFEAQAEYIELISDSSGNFVDIVTNPYTIIEFVDTNNIQWKVLSEEDESLNSPSIIKAANTVRYFNNRIIFGGIEYDSRDFSNTDLFIKDDYNKIGYGVNIHMGKDGHRNAWNQAYRKSYMRGERYSFYIQAVGDYGETSFAVPIESLDHSLINFKFPDRRDVFTGYAYSMGYTYYNRDYLNKPYGATKNSHLGASNDNIYEVFHQEEVLDVPEFSGNLINVHKDFGGYNPVTPSKLFSDKDEGFERGIPYEEIDNLGTMDRTVYADLKLCHKWSMALGLYGIDISKLPSWVRGFKILRSKPAGRVIAQGIGMYALTEGSHDPGTTATKASNRFWFYSPDIDSSVGINPLIYQDIINNPQNYKIQLVSPLGFTGHPYNGNRHEIDAKWFKIDHLVSAMFYYDNVRHNKDPYISIGQGDGYVTFGRWRNAISVGDQASGITNSTNEFIFDIVSAINKNGGESGRNPGRSQYLELIVDDSIYRYTDSLTDSWGNEVLNRQFHEPFYIINIIQDSASVDESNISTLQDTGTYIKLKSIVGVGSGNEGQKIRLVDERLEDCFAAYSYTVDENYVRYILVDDKKWMDVTEENQSDIDTWLLNLQNQGYFTVYGTSYYGIYKRFGSATRNRSEGNRIYIWFAYNLPNSNPVVPPEGSIIEVVYNPNSPIIVFGGDTYIGESVFAPIDNCQDKIAGVDGIPDIYENFRLYGPFPYMYYMRNVSSDKYFIPRDASTIELMFQITMHYLRQMMVMFLCESRINLAMAFGESFPFVNYVLRPAAYYNKNSSETWYDFYERCGLYADYYDDYGEEYYNWIYGGFRFPVHVNLDYSKDLPARTISKPIVGYEEKLYFPYRLHYSRQYNPSISNSPSLRSFPPSNIYDLKRSDLGEINILYDTVGRGGHNLYVITERGLCVLISGRSMISQYDGSILGVIESEAKFIQNEIWLSNKIGCPLDYWVSKSEGILKTADNIQHDVLVFLSNYGVHLFSDGSVLSDISTNMNDRIRGFLNDRETKWSVVNSVHNEVLVNFGSNGTYIFNMDINNWTGRPTYLFDKLIYVSDNDKPYLVGIYKGFAYAIYTEFNTHIYEHLGESPLCYIDFIIHPSSFDTFELVDLKIMSNSEPDVNIFITAYDNLGGVIITNPSYREFNPGKYLVVPRINSDQSKESLGRRIQGSYFRVRLIFNKQMGEEPYTIYGIQAGLIPIVS